MYLVNKAMKLAPFSGHCGSGKPGVGGCGGGCSSFMNPLNTML